MRFAISLGLALWSFTAAGQGSLDPPQQRYADLYAAVQMAQIFPDSKTFADATPNCDPIKILREFHAAHPASPAALRGFVMAHFTLPAPPPQIAWTQEPRSLTEHIDALWEPLTREALSAPAYSSQLPLPAPFVVPGGRFREMYYWDSYFTMLGLKQSARDAQVNDMVRDFAYLIDTYGHIPNGGRTYYLSRSQPPFFYAMVALTNARDTTAFARYLPQLKREYRFWMQGEALLRARGSKTRTHRRVARMPDGSVLNRYWDDRDTPRDESYREDLQLARGSARPAAQLYRDIRAAAESGWDFSSRWFADGHSRGSIHTTEIVPVDLNSLLYGLENAIRGGCEQDHDQACVRQFRQRAAARLRAMNRYLWNAARGAYLDFDLRHSQGIGMLSAAALYPLFVQAASGAQAHAVATAVRGELLQAGGLLTTPVTSGEQWDAPNGWAPLQWLAVSGLRHYDEDELAREIGCRWLNTIDTLYQRSGKLVEKYDVVNLGREGGGGEYPRQDGFGWTNGVTRALLALYPDCIGSAP